MGTLEERHGRRHDRIKRVRDLSRIQVVKVLPTKEKYRKFLNHMPDNIKWPAEGPAKWPFDSFTKRRLRDGDIVLVEEDESQVESLADESESVES